MFELPNQMVLSIEHPIYVCNFLMLSHNIPVKRRKSFDDEIGDVIYDSKSINNIK